MKNSICLLLLALICVNCKTAAPYKQKQQPAPAATGACNFEGKIISILSRREKDTTSPCFRHPCRARVLVIDVSGCGSAVSIPVSSGDTVEMQFAFTLDNTARIFPRMSGHYPGLKTGDLFLAKGEQRLAPGSQGKFLVYGYQIK